MSHKVALGAYVERDSFLHKLDARAALGLSLVLILAVFLINSWLALALYTLATLSILILSKQGVIATLKRSLPLIWTLAFLALFNLFMNLDGPVVATLGPVTIHERGIIAATLFPARMLCGVLIGMTTLSSVSPTKLGQALDHALKPLARFGFPAHEISLVATLMLKAIPGITRDARDIVAAMRLRGTRISIFKLSSLIQILTALIAQSMRRAQATARALIARNWNYPGVHTSLHPLRFSGRDALAAVVVCAFVVVLVWLNL